MVQTECADLIRVTKREILVLNEQLGLLRKKEDAHTIKEINAKKDVLTQLLACLKCIKSQKGFDAPLEALSDTLKKLSKSLMMPPSSSINQLIVRYQDKIAAIAVALINEKKTKYPSDFQYHSEVRLIYSIKNGELCYIVEGEKFTEQTIQDIVSFPFKS